MKTLFPNIKSNGILNTFRLDRNNIGGPEFICSSAELFGPYSRLFHINMNECGLSDKCGQAIFQALQNNRSLKSLSLSKNLLGVFI